MRTVGRRGLGYSIAIVQAWLAGKGTRAEAMIPIDHIEAAETNNPVESLRRSRSRLYLVLTLHYALRRPIHQVAQRVVRAESTIKRTLEDADAALERWLRDRTASDVTLGRPGEFSNMYLFGYIP